MNELDIRICHLYPDLLNTYGDKGNVTALERRCQWRNIPVQISSLTVGDSFDPDLYDIVFIGGGQEREQQLVCQDLLDTKADGIKEAKAKGVVFLGVSSGFQLMGDYYVDSNGTKHKALGILQIHTEYSQDKMMGDVVADCSLLTGEGQDKYITGFESHSGRTYLGEGVEPLARVLVGHGNNGQDGTEGAVCNNIFGSYLHGSLLPKNYRLTDLLILRALENKIGYEQAKEITAHIPDSQVEELARLGCIDRALHRRQG